ncbi:MAG TPA: fumarylacetoacetate hydrolase [Gammaproteobacteria bacterium]|jgi:fumarylacetoacetate (FAA) hydrolase family protein|nr:fumarylacetoacetate hydrolase [Gammaproteobacteria bacterium]
MARYLTPGDILPVDGDSSRLIGRVWSASENGPCVVLIDGQQVRNLNCLSPTVSGLLDREDLLNALNAVDTFPVLAVLDDFLPDESGSPGLAGELLAPSDLQPIKAAGVTFAQSMLERVIEEQVKGDPSKAAAIRARLLPVVGESLRGVQAGSEKAAEIKVLLQEMELWSQYLEVGIGPDAEIFTKAPPMASVGVGHEIGIHPISNWNNPEPEVVLAVSSRGQIVGATLGNDVNLRDVEGRSALLLGKAKDNNASCAIGPFIRLLDTTFTMTALEQLEVSLRVEGEDGFVIEGISPMKEISRSPSDLVSQTLNRNHQYPDGVMLFLGTMFAPTQDRRGPGTGFTHEIGDRVEISSPELGCLINWVRRTDDILPWTFGTRALMENLAVRGLL